MAIQPAQPQSIGGVLDTAFQLYKVSLVRALPLTLLLVIASSPASIYMMMHGALGSSDPFAMLTLMRSSGYWLALCATYLGVLWMSAALLLKMSAIGADGDLSVGAALQNALGRVLYLFLMMILLFIVLAIGYVLLLVPGIILTVSLALCFNVAVLENKGPIDSLTGSHRLVWGHWWRTTAILSVGFVVIMVIYFVVILLVGVVAGVMASGSGENLALLSGVFGIVISDLLSVVVTPFYVALVIATYWDLKLRKEGGDLAARVGALNPA
jgi:hypothetical protein